MEIASTFIVIILMSKEIICFQLTSVELYVHYNASLVDDMEEVSASKYKLLGALDYVFSLVVIIIIMVQTCL